MSRLLTGARPTGTLHIGHLVGALQRFMELQHTHEPYFIVSDIHMLTTKTDPAHLATQRELVLKMVATVVGCGVDLSRTNFLLQSAIPELSQIYAIIQNFIPADRVLSSPTLLETKTPDYSFGLAGYPVLESADILGVGARLVPVGEDNVDHVEIARSICERLVADYGVPFDLTEPVTSQASRLIGTDGLSKMSKSVGNAILLSDDPDTIRVRVNGMRWPDGPEGPVRTYLQLFAPSDYAARAEAGWDSDPRAALAEVLVATIEPIRQRTAEVLSDPQATLDAMRHGTNVARGHVAQALDNLKNSLGMTTLAIQPARR